MLKLRLAVVLGCASVVVPAAAEAPHVAVWDAASHYVCQAEAYRVCTGMNPVCVVSPNSMLLEIDFKANTITIPGLGRQLPERIVLRRFQQFDPVVGDIHMLATSQDNRSINFGLLVKDENGRISVPATFLTTNVQHMSTHFMRCEAETPVG